MSDSTIPSCIGYYGAPIASSGPCESCSYADVCVKMIPKEKLKPLVEHVERMQRILRGEMET